jgi:predicted hotdog family 3-hydroxylacyl-ACP dehydratase
MSHFNNFTIDDLLPHSGDMVLLDRIIAADETSMVAELVVRGDGLLGGNDKTVPAWAGIEYMAQTVAAYAGLMAKQAGEPIKLGFLLGTRRYHSNVAEFNVDSTLTVRVEKIMQDEMLGVFDCCIQGVSVNVHGVLNVYQSPSVIKMDNIAVTASNLL